MPSHAHHRSSKTATQNNAIGSNGKAEAQRHSFVRCEFDGR